MRSELVSHFADEKTDAQEREKYKDLRPHSLFITDLGIKEGGPG